MDWNWLYAPVRCVLLWIAKTAQELIHEQAHLHGCEVQPYAHVGTAAKGVVGVGMLFMFRARIAKS